MKRFQSILCASLLTLAMSSAALAGDMTGKPGDMTGKPGDMTGLTDEAYDAILGVLSAILG